MAVAQEIRSTLPFRGETMGYPRSPIVEQVRCLHTKAMQTLCRIETQNSFGISSGDAEFSTHLNAEKRDATLRF
jgi:hypothetical protein